MRSWDALPKAILKPAGSVTEAFIDIGATDFRSAAAWVNCLPYGRNAAPDGETVVFRDRHGTCSTKHALLRRLAIEQSLDVELCLGIYYMTERNTPGVGRVLERNGLAMIPEAHCFLRYGRARVDVTRVLADRSNGSITRLAHMEVISPDQIGRYKNEVHRHFLREWITRRSLTSAFTLDEIWSIREECIAALAHLSESDVRGIDLDSEARCAHYHGPTDIVAIKMYCCRLFYACKECHEELADHEIQVWPESDWDEKAILCGVCQTQLSIRGYLSSGYSCPACDAKFNPKCETHRHYYFR